MPNKDIALATSLFVSVICSECKLRNTDNLISCCIKLSPCKIVEDNNFYISCDNFEKKVDKYV